MSAISIRALVDARCYGKSIESTMARLDRDIRYEAKEIMQGRVMRVLMNARGTMVVVLLY